MYQSHSELLGGGWICVGGKRRHAGSSAIDWPTGVSKHCRSRPPITQHTLNSSEMCPSGSHRSNRGPAADSTRPASPVPTSPVPRPPNSPTTQTFSRARLLASPPPIPLAGRGEARTEGAGLRAAVLCGDNTDWMWH